MVRFKNMRSMGPAFFLLAVWTLVAAASDRESKAPQSQQQPAPVPAMEADQPVHLPGIHNAVAFAPGLISGSVPEGESGFDSLKSMGVQTIISVDGARPSVEMAAAKGFRYVHLPIGYNGMDRQRTLEIARAIEVARQGDPEAVVYVHCHHGKHRSAGALGAAVVTLGLSTTDQVVARMKVSGTSPSYTGLYQCVSDARVAKREELDGMPVEFPSVWKTSGLVRSMVEVDEIYEHLKVIEKGGWVAPKEHPDLVPAAEAGRLADVYRNLLDDERVKSMSADFRQYMARSSTEVELLEAGLIDTNTPKDVLTERFKTITASCKECHVRYRD